MIFFPGVYASTMPAAAPAPAGGFSGTGCIAEMLAGVERQWRLDRVERGDRPAETFPVGAGAGGEIRHRRFMSKLAAQRLSRRIELTPLAADAARPRITPQRVDHRAAHAAF